MSKICGTSGKMNGKSCCYTLVDYFFKREVLLNFSWSGGSREKEKKNCFKIYANVINTFYLIVQKADNQFSLKQCEDFFKSIVKNAKRRADNLIKEEARKRTSNTKKRPDNLIYNKIRNEAKRQQSNESENQETDEQEEEQQQEYLKEGNEDVDSNII